MNRNVVSLISAILVAWMPVLGVVPSVLADSECSVATLKGTFGASSTWFTQGTGATAATFASRPAAQLGIVTFDGAGNWFQPFSTQSNNGVIFTFSGPGGTYTVDSNCIATFTTSTQPIQTVKFVIVAKRPQFLIPTPNPFFPGWVPTGGVAVKIGDETCSLATVKGTYGFNSTGFFQGTGSATDTVASFPSIAGGIITVDGAGGFSVQQTQSTNGVIASSTFTGTYTVSPNCTGSSRDMFGGTTNFVIVADGDEVLFISTMPGAVVTGVLKKNG